MNFQGTLRVGSFKEVWTINEEWGRTYVQFVILLNAFYQMIKKCKILNDITCPQSINGHAYNVGKICICTENTSLNG